MTHPFRRHDDPRPQVDAGDVEQFFAELPVVIDDLRRGRRSNRRLARMGIVVALFVAAAFIILAAFYENALDRIDSAAKQDRKSAFEQCQLVNDNGRALNSFIDAAVAAVKANDTLTRSEKNYRVSLYESIKQRLPLCERP